MVLAIHNPGASTAIKRSPNVFIPDGSLDHWLAAKKSASSNPASLVVIGDSISVGGSHVTNFLTQPWFQLVRASLVSQIGSFADTYGPGNDGYASQFAITGWGNSNPYAGHVAAFPTSTSQSCSFVTPNACTRIDLIYFPQTNASTFTWAVDGGSANSVTVVKDGVHYLYRISITGLANTSHTVVLSNFSVNTPLFLLSFVCYSGTAGGLHAWNCSRTGQASPSFASAGAYNGWAGIVTTAPTFGFGLPYFADLAIIALSVNDLFANGGVEPDGYQCIWSNVIRSLRFANPGCSIMFLAYDLPSAIASDAGDWLSTGSFSQFYPRWIQKMYDMSEEFNCAVANVFSRWGEKPVAQGFLVSGDVHPLVAGHADIASFLLGVI